VPEIVDYDLPVAGAFHNCAIVRSASRIRGTREGDARALGAGMLSLTKAIVTSTRVDPHDYAQVVLPRRERRSCP
jgi:4-hydroxy-3-polyprenylbenzoate decarboxylase